MNPIFFSKFINTILEYKLYTLIICIVSIGVILLITLTPIRETDSTNMDFNISTVVWSSFVYTIPLALLISFLCFRDPPS